MDGCHNIFRKMLNAEPISKDDPEFHVALERYKFVRNIIPRLNAATDDETRSELFCQLFGHPLDPTTVINPPFYTDWGKFISIGRNTFINNNCTMLDQGGIEIGNDVLIGPGVSLITANHGLEPNRRGFTTCKKIVLEDNVWLGANSTILPGVTVGRNSVVAACSVVTRDIPPGTMVMGHPARFYKKVGD